MMNQPEILEWVEQAQRGEITWTHLAEQLLKAAHPATAIDQPDLDRGRRCGYGEVIFGQRKSARTIISIANRLLDSGQTEVLVTRCAREQLPEIFSRFPYSRIDCLANTIRLSRRPIHAVNDSYHESVQTGSVMVVTAGSTDLPIAREALETLRWMGVAADLLTDVGVAGPYRLLPHLGRLRDAQALVVCAGMEGALASVLGGLVAVPIIAVPTSVGYGSNLSGVTTLLSMLSSCAAGVTVVNVDAGFKGGYVAGLIATNPRSIRP
jgi:pyridinium-3,5-biscarboxylic acid mononucleotide synthase